MPTSEKGPEQLRLRSDMGPAHSSDDASPDDEPVHTTDGNHLHLFDPEDSSTEPLDDVDVAALLIEAFPGSVIEQERV